MNVLARIRRWLLAPRNTPTSSLNALDQAFQARSDIAAQRRRAEEQMWRVVFQRRTT